MFRGTLPTWARCPEGGVHGHSNLQPLGLVVRQEKTIQPFFSCEHVHSTHSSRRKRHSDGYRHHLPVQILWRLPYWVLEMQSANAGWVKGADMSSQTVMTNVSCAVEVFLAAALLHREQPAREDFTIQEIVGRAARENVAEEMRSGVSVHASQHCVANRAPNPAKNRMLFATGKHTRRLLLPGDEAHPERTGKILPEPSELPENYLPLLD